jgi:hypothetical protein
MKTPILLACILVLPLAGCGGGESYVREEKIVEKQPVIIKEKEVIVEKRVAPAEIVVERPAAALQSCTYGAVPYSHGSLTCQVGYEYRCTDGTWVSRNLAC